MNRRRFLLSASVAVLAAKLLSTTPTLAAALPTTDFIGIPYQELVRIESAFRILEDLKLGQVAQLRNFGMFARTYDKVHELREAAHEVATISRDFWERADLIETINKELVRRVGPDVNDHFFWLATEPKDAKFRFRDSLEFGLIEELLFLVTYLSSPYNSYA